MRQELDDLLCVKYPLIFKRRRESVKDTPMGFGIDVPDTWFQLVDTLCDLIQKHVDQRAEQGIRNGFPQVPQVVAEQVKSKFGSLCFYYEGGDDFVHGAVAHAQMLSTHLCEECGSLGSRRKRPNRSSAVTLCVNHSVGTEEFKFSHH